MEEKDVQRLIDMLYTMIDEAKSAAFSAEKCTINRDEALDILDEMRSKLPLELKKAKELIAKNPEEPIKNVAEQVGCGNNPQYFSQLFKKQTGMTPTDYITSLGH